MAEKEFTRELTFTVKVIANPPDQFRYGVNVTRALQEIGERLEPIVFDMLRARLADNGSILNLGSPVIESVETHVQQPAE